MSDRNNIEHSTEHARSMKSRRDALATAAKFAAFVAPASYVLLDSESAKAQSISCRGNPNTKGNDGCG